LTVTSQAASYAEQLVMFKKRCKIGTWLLQTTNRKSLFSSIVQTRVWCMKWTGFWCNQCQVGADVERDSSDVEHQLCCVDGSQHCRRSGARELLRDNHRSVDILSSWRVKYWPSVSWHLVLLFASNVFEANHGNTLWSKRTAFTHLAMTHWKWIDLDEIWNSVSQLLGAGPGRFNAQ